MPQRAALWPFEVLRCNETPVEDSQLHERRRQVHLHNSSGDLWDFLDFPWVFGVHGCLLVLRLRGLSFLQITISLMKPKALNP